MDICLIGCGTWAANRHGPVLRECAREFGDIRLGACCDINQERAESFRETFGFEKSYEDAEDMLSDYPGAIVCLVVPPPFMKEQALKVMEKGHRLLLEKPPGLCRDDTLAMAKKAREKGLVNQVAFNRRHMPIMKEARELIVRVLDSTEPDFIQYDMYRVNRSDEFSTTAVHGIDAVRFLTGDDYSDLDFSYRPYPELSEHAADIFISGSMKQGTRVRLNFVTNSGCTYERFQLSARDHLFAVDLPFYRSSSLNHPMGRIRHFYRDELIKEFIGDRAEENRGNGVYDEYVSFFSDLRAGREPSCTLESSLSTMEVMECIRKRAPRLP